MKNKFLTLDPMQQHFPSVGSYFQIGALPPPVAQVFVRSVASKTEVKFPLFSPGLENFAGDSPPSAFLPDNWVFGGDMARRIFEDVMAHDANDILNSCRDMFNKQENCPFRFMSADHPGFSELTRVQTVPFHEDPASLWTGPLTVGWVARQGKDLNLVGRQAISYARDFAFRQTGRPAITAADQVSIVHQSEEGEPPGSATAPHSLRNSHGGRAKFAKKR